MAKEALFNILYNTYDLDCCDVLDLFCGTGNISIEFASRGARLVTAVDLHPRCVSWVRTFAEKHQLKQVSVQKADVFKFLGQDRQRQYHIIFADPPYDLPSIPDLPRLIMEHGLLTGNGVLVVEHPSLLKLDGQPGYRETRRYGNSSFSFFEKTGV